MIMYRASLMHCPAPLCRSSWAFTPANPRSYWSGRHATHGKIVDHVVMDHTSAVPHLMRELGRQEARWWK